MVAIRFQIKLVSGTNYIYIYIFASFKNVYYFNIFSNGK
jgi:hypothetical protein